MTATTSVGIAPAITDFTTSSASAPADTSVELNWRIVGGIGSSWALSGEGVRESGSITNDPYTDDYNLTVPSAAGSYTYTLSVSGRGTDRRQVNVTVTVP